MAHLAGNFDSELGTAVTGRNPTVREGVFVIGRLRYMHPP